MLETFIKTYGDRTYKHVSMVRHKGSVVAFAMDQNRRIYYSVLDLQNSEIDSPLDVNYWLDNPIELLFPNEVAEVGIGVADQSQLPVVKIGSRLPKPPGTRVLRDEKDLFLSTTARFTADTPFQAMSDGRHIFIFRQAIAADHPDIAFKRDADGELITDADGQPVPLVDATLLADRFVLSGTTLQTKMEVRFQRSRSKTRPQSRKDSLGAKDMEERPFFEPTQELRFIGNLSGGRFNLLLLPTQIAGVQRWQIFAYNGSTDRLDSYSIERANDGLFNTRGTRATTSTGSAESALHFSEGNTVIDLGRGVTLGGNFTQEAWLLPTDGSGDSASALGQGLITASGNFNDAPPSVWTLQGRGLRAGFGDGTKWYEFRTGNILRLNSWNHVAVTFDGSAYRVFVNGEQRHRANQAKVYIDGVRQEDDEAFAGKQPATAPLLYFGSPDPVGSAFKGTVDEIRLWNRARSQKELLADMHQRLSGREIGLLGYWRFDEASGDIAYDHSDNGIDGVIQNGAWVTSTAPVGDTGGVNRNSFRIAGRTVASGMSALLYSLQENSASGYDDEPKPLKHSTRVMLCVATRSPGSANNEITALDFGVSGAGKLAQIPDVLDLPKIQRPTIGGHSVEEMLNHTSALQQDIIGLNEDIVNLTDSISLINQVTGILNEVIEGRGRSHRVPVGEFSELNTRIEALWVARDSLVQAKTRKRELDHALINARIHIYEHAHFRGRSLSYGRGYVGYRSLNRHGFNDIISSIVIDAPLQIRVYEHANRGGKARTMTSTTAWVGDSWNDIISSIDVSEKSSHATQRSETATSVQTAQAIVNRLTSELSNERNDLAILRRSRELERASKEEQRTGKRTELNDLQSLLNEGVAVSMPFVHASANGLSITGGILEFAWTDDTPLLFDSATGKLAMYFRGADDQFFIAYYNTLTQRARYQLVDEKEVRSVVCVARSTEPEFDSLTLEVSGEAEDTTCTVRITGAGMEENWQQVPRQLQAFARVLNGEATDRAYIGSGTIEKVDGRVERVNIPEGVRRNLIAGTAILAGDVKMRLVEAAAKGVTILTVASSVLDVSGETVPLFFIEYDYAALASTTQIPDDLTSGSRLLAVTAAAESGRVQIGQKLSSGATIASQWSAFAPGHTLALDGEKSFASFASTNETDLKNFAAKGDLTLEAWARPNRIDNKAMIVQHRSQTSNYTLGLQAQILESALQLDGESTYVLISNATSLNFVGAITIEAWIRPQAHNGLRNIVAHGYRLNPDEGIFLRINEGFYEAGSWDGADHLVGFEMPTEDKTGNRWVHLTGVYDGLSWRLFRDGVEVAAAEDRVGAIKVNAPWALGACGNATAERVFAGDIDEVRIWKRGRTGDAIHADMNRRLGGNEPDLVGYWHFEGGTAQDYSRYNNHGTVQGAPSVVQTALNGFSVYAGVSDRYVQTDRIFSAGSWTHLAAVFNQSYALQFDGNESYLDAGNDATLDNGADLTIEIFLKADMSSTELGLLTKGHIDDGTDQAVPYAAYLDRSGKLVFGFEDKEHALHVLSSTAEVPTGTFNRLAITRKHQVVTTERTNQQGQVIGADVDQWDEITFYNNGEEIGLHQYRGANAGSSSGSLEIGRCFLPGFLERCFQGTISEVRIWSIAREPANLGVDINDSEGGLVSWWRCEENEGNMAFDAKSSNHAKLRGNVEWVKNPEANASPLSLFVDGESVAAGNLSPGNFTAPQPQFTLGALGNSTTVQDYLQGELEELRVWRVARTQEQIQDNLFRRLLDEKEELLAYYTFDAEQGGKVSDHSLRGNNLLTHDCTYVLSTAPIGEDTPQVRSALAGLKTPFNGLLGGRPAVQEYGDMQHDSQGNLIGVLKRCYAFIREGQWLLVTGFKVGNLTTEWVGQAQFAPQLIGFIEGAPPVPSENLTGTGTVLGEFTDYNDASTVEIVEAQDTNYTYAAERESGFDMMIDGKAGWIIGTEAAVGFVLVVKSVDVENVFGAHFNFEHSLGWLENAKSGSGISTSKASKMSLRGRVENDDGIAFEDIGRRFVPENNGFALVQSETADIFALRLQHNKALVSYYMRPNPDIPKDWNVISFPINRQYCKQGTLDGKVGLEPDADHPNALTYSPDSSYFKPIEAYALKSRIQREEERLKTYYDQYDAGAKGRRQADAQAGSQDLGAGNILEKLPKVHKRNLVNTFVWTADGGLLAETQETLDMQEEAIGGSYSFKALAGLYTDLTVNVLGTGFKFELDALFGGHLNLTVTKSETSETTFGVNVDLGGVEGDIFLRDEQGKIIIDNSDARNPKPVKWPGKVDAYRFMTFYLEPRTDHFDQFFSKIVDPIWLEQSDEPNAVALREARQVEEKPRCWRMMHRVTYVSRVLPPLDASPPPLEKSMRELDIDSNYELIKLLEPFVANKLTNYAEFAGAIRETIITHHPELQPHVGAIIQFMGLYYGITDDPALMAAVDEFDDQESTGGLLPAPQIDAGPAFQTVPADSSLELQGSLLSEDRSPDDFLITWHQVSGPDALIIANPDSLTTSVQIGGQGIYVLRLTASDGLLTHSDDIAIAANTPPVISAGGNLEVLPNESAELVGAILDDGRADAQRSDLLINWSLISGPGDVEFSNEDALRTNASFNNSGFYLLRLQVTNGTFEVTDELMVAVAARVSDGLQALYVFEESLGTEIREVSGREPSLPLSFAADGNATWISGGLAISEPSIIQANRTIHRILHSIKVSNELTIETWVNPSLDEQPGLARIVTLAGHDNGRNFILGQRGASFYAGVRTNTTNANASNKALAGGQVSAGALTHVVCTREVSGMLRLFVDGEEVVARLVAGSFANWAMDYVLALGNEPASENGLDRAWSGAYHLLALYDRALSPQEVKQNFEFGGDTNLTPEVETGADQTVNLPNQVDLTGNVRDDRLLPDQLSVKWTQASGPTSVVFENAEMLNSRAMFETSGKYVLRLTVSDGQLSSSDELQVIVNQAPVIDAGGTQRIALPNSTQLQGVLQSDGLGDDDAPRNLNIEWSQISGPGQATFQDMRTLDTEVRFTAYGAYVLQLGVDNGLLQPTVAEVTIFVSQAPVFRTEAPAIVTMPEPAALIAEEIDLGLADPDGVIRRKWSKVSGPGDVTFAEADALSTSAQFSASGNYVLRLEIQTRGEGYQLAASSDVTIVANSAPVVDAGPAQTIQLPAQVELEGTVTDDGLPDPPGVTSVEWRKKSGPGEVGFSEARAATTKARFSKSGIYELELVAKDYDQAVAVTDSVLIELLPAPRIISDLQVLYKFEEQGGEIVRDVSAVDPPLDLTLANLSGQDNAVSWLGNSLRINSTVIFKSATGVQRLIDACSSSNEITLEAWIKRAASIASDQQPGRILTLSVDPSLRNFTLGQSDDERFQARLLSTATKKNGSRLRDSNKKISPEIEAVDEVCHLVFTRDSNGKVGFYINGVDPKAESRRDIGGKLNNWGNPPSYQLALANELTGNRPWLGEYFLIAVYSRALTEEEVLQNFNAKDDAGVA